ncbi:putative sulfate exporter family transporter [Leucothrix arctica]|uniref:Putative sulfate exporter family transporter n=2 Tax=Leucothrix arctica TaxID=1481894 RepID=A0A317C6T8_9GAMM|nr:putative sulfate exporter family transporter [Leucothrix arctica]
MTISPIIDKRVAQWNKLFAGFAVSAIVAVTAQFFSEHYGAPAMLMALLLGIAFNFLSEEGNCVHGISFTAKTVLRFGVALLGVRISAELIVGLGPELIGMIIVGVFLTIGLGFVIAKLLGRNWRLGLLTGGSVAICGASAAMAIAAVLPKNQYSERNLVFTVLSVTLLSTFAMVLYPIIAESLALSPVATGVFLGGTIHDVAQVVGAGFSVSQETGDTATLVKLIRVCMLAPVVLLFAIVIRAKGLEDNSEGSRPPLVPSFIIGFLILATINSLGLIPESVAQFFSDVSRWALLIAIAAVGMKTSLRRMLDVGGQAVLLIVLETVFIVGFVLAGLSLFV